MKYIFLYNIDGNGGEVEADVINILDNSRLNFIIEDYAVDVECEGKSIWVDQKDFMLAIFLTDEDRQPGEIQQIYNKRINNIRYSSSKIKN